MHVEDQGGGERTVHMSSREYNGLIEKPWGVLVVDGAQWYYNDPTAGHNCTRITSTRARAASKFAPRGGPAVDMSESFLVPVDVQDSTLAVATAAPVHRVAARNELAGLVSAWLARHSTHPIQENLQRATMCTFRAHGIDSYRVPVLEALGSIVMQRVIATRAATVAGGFVVISAGVAQTLAAKWAIRLYVDLLPPLLATVHASPSLMQLGGARRVQSAHLKRKRSADVAFAKIAQLPPCTSNVSVLLKNTVRCDLSMILVTIARASGVSIDSIVDISYLTALGKHQSRHSVVDFRKVLKRDNQNYKLVKVASCSSRSTARGSHRLPCPFNSTLDCARHMNIKLPKKPPHAITPVDMALSTCLK
tara:strand:+ start:3217 stop:4308 length:1092 start_codon:yes stop_codon:yes gene_type:complete